MSLNKLLKTARRSDHKIYNHAALVIKGGAILSSGYNHGWKHAEVHALEKLWPNKRKGTTVIVIRASKSKFGPLGNSRPCQKCIDFLKENGVVRVIYSCNNVAFLSERL